MLDPATGKYGPFFHREDLTGEAGGAEQRYLEVVARAFAAELAGPAPRPASYGLAQHLPASGAGGGPGRGEGP